MSAVSLVSILSAADLPGAISHMMPFSGAIWELHILAANAYRKGRLETAEALVVLADAAEREWLRGAG